MATPQLNSTAPQSDTPADIPASIEGLDKSRQGVAKLVQKNLLHSMKNALKNGTYQASESEMDLKATRLALEIERATFDSHPDKASYAAQGRRVAANLKTNQDLCDRLLSQSLAPMTLAVMTDDEMASKEFRRQTAEMKARADKQSIMVTDDGPRIRRTHKGDEVVEQDSVSIPGDEPPSARRHSLLDQNPVIGAPSREDTHDNEVELPQDIDDYHSQDHNQGNAPSSHPLNVDTKSSPTMRKASTHGEFDINRVFSSIQSPTARQSAHSPAVQAKPKKATGIDAEIDRLLEENNESPPYSPREFVTDDTIVWRGTLHMNSIADFTAVARHIGGADLSDIGADSVPWTDLIPPRLQVAGRIDRDKANQYLCSLRYSPPTDVVVVALSPAGEAGINDFTNLFEYFNSKNRYGVVGNKGFGNVRDTYLVPVPAGIGNVPEFLLNLACNKVPEERLEAMILVVLAVRNEIVPSTSQLDGAGSPSAVVSHPQRQMSISGNSGPAMSPINPHGSFGSPLAPQSLPAPAHVVQNDQQQIEAQRRQRAEAQSRGEAVAREILGPFITAPTVNFLLPQAWEMQPTEWQIIREIYEQEPKARDDLTFLSQLLEKKNASNPAK